MSFKYKFTVFTPCYNSEKTLHRVFDSLMAQTIDHKEFEWIVVNDASIDKTHELILEYIKKADFNINYINLKQNQMLIKNIWMAIEKAQGEYFLGIGHDDGFVGNTLRTFDSIIKKMSHEEKEKCASIVCLSQSQDGEAIGGEYPVDNQFITSLDYTFKINKSKIGENWGVLNTKYLKQYYDLPDDIDKLKYIPESFFWTKMALEMQYIKTNTYVINKRLRIYYIENNGLNISTNIRRKYAQGFEYESLYFINNYVSVQLLHNPSHFIKHLIKYIWTSNYNKKSFFESLSYIKNFPVKLLYILFSPVLIIKKQYFK